MKTTLTTLVTALILTLCACSKQHTQQTNIQQLLPYTLLNPTALLPFDPNVEQPNGTNQKLSQILQQFHGQQTTVVIWASWCPPDTLYHTPTILLSIDQSTDAWKLAIGQIPTHPTTLHGRIDPYQTKNFLTYLDVQGVPYTLYFDPQGAPIAPSNR